MKKKAITKQLELYPLPEEKSNERGKQWAQNFTKKMETQFERVSNKEYHNWLTK